MSEPVQRPSGEPDWDWPPRPTEAIANVAVAVNGEHVGFGRDGLVAALKAMLKPLRD